MKAILFVLGAIAVLELTAFLANVAIWLLTPLTQFIVPAILIGFIPTTIYLVHRTAKAYL